MHSWASCLALGLMYAASCFLSEAVQTSGVQAQGLHMCLCAGPRISHAAEMLLEVQQWLQKTLPYWDRKGGRDHIWLMSHVSTVSVAQQRSCLFPK